MPTLEEIEGQIREKEASLDAIGQSLNELRSVREKLREKMDEDHFENPRPGDFWHECFSPVFIVLEVCEDGVFICEKTKAVYEPPDQQMVMRSYANPEDPEVKRYFAQPRRETGYTFDLKATRKVSVGEFRGMLKCYGNHPQLKDKLAYRCIPGNANGFLPFWEEMKVVDLRS